MFTVLLFMFAGIACGYFLRKVKIGFTGSVTTTLIWLLLFLLGAEVGLNEAVVKNFGKLGFDAFLVAFFATLGSITAAKFLWNKKTENH
jgi:uncharacterized membrane protein YbjE (DUF340 family)